MVDGEKRGADWSGMVALAIVALMIAVPNTLLFNALKDTHRLAVKARTATGLVEAKRVKLRQRVLAAEAELKRVQGELQARTKDIEAQTAAREGLTQRVAVIEGTFNQISVGPDRSLRWNGGVSAPPTPPSPPAKR